jgi:hypothetical protein
VLSRCPTEQFCIHRNCFGSKAAAIQSTTERHGTYWFVPHSEPGMNIIIWKLFWLFTYHVFGEIDAYHSSEQNLNHCLNIIIYNRSIPFYEWPFTGLVFGHCRNRTKIWPEQMFDLWACVSIYERLKLSLTCCSRFPNRSCLVQLAIFVQLNSVNVTSLFHTSLFYIV